MSVLLEIPDGNPWWLSPHVWTVPGDNPEGSEGLPVAGSPCYLWARVTNGGRDRVENATVRFYWANPAVGFDRTTANLVGTSFVSLEAGATREVLSLTPWIPQFVNNGHECILAEAFHPTFDPLPATPAFDVPQDRHVAQRNLSVLLPAQPLFFLPFEVHNPGRKAAKYRIDARVAPLKLAAPLLKGLGRTVHVPEREGKPPKLGFVQSPCPREEDLKALKGSIAGLAVPPRQRAGLTLVGEAGAGACLVHVEQTLDGRLVGGLSVLVLPQGKATSGKKEKGA